MNSKSITYLFRSNYGNGAPWQIKTMPGWVTPKRVRVNGHLFNRETGRLVKRNTYGNYAYRLSSVLLPDGTRQDYPHPEQH